MDLFHFLLSGAAVVKEEKLNYLAPEAVSITPSTKFLSYIKISFRVLDVSSLLFLLVQSLARGAR